MKGNNGTGNTIERDDWQTPQWLFDKLNKQYEFDFDCCASSENKKCSLWHDDFLRVGNEEVGLYSDEVCWMNPPFSKSEEMFKHFFKVVETGVAIYRCDNIETALWQEVILKNVDWIFIPKGRISYEGKEGTVSRFPSALMGIGIEQPQEIDGTVLFVKNAKTENKK